MSHAPAKDGAPAKDAAAKGGAPARAWLLDERSRPSLRDALRRALRSAGSVDLALGRIRLAGLDLEPDDLRTVTRCRLLIGRFDAATLLDAADDARADAHRRRGLGVLRDFVADGRLSARSAGLSLWAPDFSLFRPPAPGLHATAFVGAHWFTRPSPLGGLALTTVLRGPDAVRVLERRYEEFWELGRDVDDVLLEVLDRLAGARWPRRVRERAPAVAPRPSRGVPDAASGAGVARAIVRARFPRSFQAHDPLATPLTPHQREGSARAEAILHRRGGAIIADGVGLGKTYIALAMIERRLRDGGRVLVITPASLRRRWLADLGRLARELGVGEPIDAGRGADGAVAWLSSARLSRGDVAMDHLLPRDLIVVDEAHAFRSRTTRRHRALARLCRRTPVVLLTATPVNNSPLDLYALIRLFCANNALCDVGVGDLRAAFRSAARAEDGAGAREILAAARAVMIRRSRALVRARESGVESDVESGVDDPRAPRLHLPRLEPPRPLEASFEPAAPGFADALRGLRDLSCAAYDPDAFDARRDRARPAVGPALIRLLLVKRAASGPPALLATIRRQLRFMDDFVHALDGGRVIRRLDREHADGRHGDGDALQLSIEALIYGDAPAALDRAALRAAVLADVEILRALAGSLAPVASSRCDPKIAALESLLASLGSERTVIFTEYRDTARALWTVLVRRHRVGLIDGDGAWLGDRRSSRGAVVARFAPAANGFAQPPERERVDVLVATDVLAEGLNLQDARHVVSFDLPWNPVRVIQRVGRIDRFGSPHGSVTAHYFLPEPAIEQELRLLRTLDAKLSDIEALTGADAAVLAGRVRARDADAIDAIEARLAAPFELHDELIARAGAVGPSGPEADVAPNAASRGQPAAVAIPVRDVPGGTTLVALDVAGGAAWIVVRPGGTATPDEELAGRILRAAFDCDVATPASAALPRAVAAAVDAVRRGRWAGGEDASALARTLLRRVGAAPGPPDPARLQRVDSILERMRAGGRVPGLVATPGGDGDEDLVTLLDAVDAELARAGCGANEPRLVGAIEVVEAEGASG